MPTIENLVHYFSNPLPLLTLLISFGSLSVCSYLFFTRGEKPKLRSDLLSTIFALSTFNWTFIGVSLVLCSFFVGTGEEYSMVQIKNTFAVAILLGILVSLFISFIVMQNASKIILSTMDTMKPSDSKEFFALNAMKKMANDMNMLVPDFVVTNKMAVSLAIGGKNPTIVISRDLINLLNKDELETVLAHELAHIKNGDAKIKTIASVFKHILFFDPLIKFVEPAIHREKEFLADEISAKITKNPTALVSALLKIYQLLKVQGGRNLASSLVIVGSGEGIFSKFPPLEKRVERLLKIEAALK